MKTETRLLLLEVELEMAKERLVFKKQQIEKFKYAHWLKKEAWGSKQEELEDKEKELQPLIEVYEQALDAVQQANNQSMDINDTGFPQFDEEFIQSEIRKLAGKDELPKGWNYTESDRWD